MKIIRTLGILFLLIVAVCGGYLWLHREVLASQYLSDKLEMEISLQRLSITPNSFHVDGIEILDPVTQIHLTADELTVEIPFTHFFRKPLVITRIVLSNVSIQGDISGIDLKELNNYVNLTKIFKKVKKAIASPKEEKSKASASFQFVVRELTVAPVTIRMKSGELEHTYQIPSIYYEHFNSEKPIDAHSLIKLLLKSSIKKITP